MIGANEIHAPASPAGEIRHGVSQVGRDVVALVELQSELLNVELRQWIGKCSGPALLWGAAAAAMALASLPLLLLAAAYALFQTTDLSLAAALALVGGAAIAVATVCAVVAWRRLRCGRGAFARFRSELARNIRWLSDVLSHPAETADRLASDHEPVKPR